MRKEKTGVVVLGIILGLAINFFFFAGLTGLSVGTTIYDVEYYKKIFTADGVIDEFYKYAEDEFADSLEENSTLAQYDIEYDDIFSRDFMKQFIDDFVDGMLGGEKNVFDDDYYEDYILDEVVPELEDQTGYRISVAEQEDLVDDFVNDMNKSIKDARKDMDDNTIYENLDQKDNILLGSYVLLGIAVILSVVMVIIHKNKFLAMRKISTAVFIAAFVEWILWSAMRTSFSEFIDEEYSKRGADKNMKPIMEALAEVFLKEPMIWAGVITGIGLAGLIIFSILSKRKGKSDDEDVEEAYRYNSAEYYAHTAAPLQSQGYDQHYGQPVSNPYGQPVSNPYGQPTPGVSPYGQPTPANNPYGQQAQFDPNNYTANSAPAQNTYSAPAEEEQGGLLKKIIPGLPPEDDGLS